MTDDLPRTLRREREARERAGQTGLSGYQSAGSATMPAPTPSYVPEPTQRDSLMVSGGTVTAIRIPFVRLMLFGFKLVLAAIPALLLFGCLLWLAGQALKVYFPWLLHFKIVISPA